MSRLEDHERQKEQYRKLLWLLDEMLAEEDAYGSSDILAGMKDLRDVLSKNGISDPLRPGTIKVSLSDGNYMLAHAKDGGEYDGIIIMYQDEQGQLFKVAEVEGDGSDNEDDEDPDSIRVYGFSVPEDDDPIEEKSFSVSKKALSEKSTATLMADDLCLM